ncbi:MAG: hypothetical protein WDZ91_01745 [Paenibacillaceae bacterium]
MVYGLFILGTYFCGALAIHLAYSWVNSHDVEAKHYVLYTLDNQLHIEWIIRSLIVFHWLQGKSISITIIDEGSSDDTIAILSLLSKHHRLDVRLLDDEGPQLLPLRDTSIHIRLSQPEDLRKLPQVSTLW